MKLLALASAYCFISTMAQAKDFDFVQEIQILASPESVWDALTKPELVKQYHLAPLKKIELKKDGGIIYGTEDEVMISGTVVDFQKDVRLVHLFRFGALNHAGTKGDPDTLVTYEIRKDGASTILKLTHSGFTEENQTRANISGGWPHILLGLKKMLESAP